MTRWHWILLALSVIVLFVAVLSGREDRDADGELPAALADEPELYMRRADIVQYTIAGSVDYRLLADEIFHYPDRQRTRLTFPDLSVYPRPGDASVTPAADAGADGPLVAPPWRIKARTGTVHHLEEAGEPRERIVLEGDVEVVHLDPAGDPTRMTTDTLVVLPARRYAETDRPVMIVNRLGNTTAGGLRGFLDRGVLELQSSAEHRVETVVHPNRS